MLEEVLSLTKWKKKKQILAELKAKGINVSERSFRKQVQIYNRLFGDSKVDFYIVHSVRGYKKSFNWKKLFNQLQITEREPLQC